MATPPALSRTLHRCRYTEEYHPVPTQPGTTTKLFSGGNFSQEGKQQQWKLPCDSWNVPWESLESRILLRGLRNVPVYWKPFDKQQKRNDRLKALPAFSLPGHTAKDTARRHRGPVPASFCAGLGAQTVLSPPPLPQVPRLRAPLLFKPGPSLGPSDQASQRGKSVRCTQGGVGGGDLATKLLIKETTNLKKLICTDLFKISSSRSGSH